MTSAARGHVLERVPTKPAGALRGRDRSSRRRLSHALDCMIMQSGRPGRACFATAGGGNRLHKPLVGKGAGQSPAVPEISIVICNRASDLPVCGCMTTGAEP